MYLLVGLGLDPKTVEHSWRGDLPRPKKIRQLRCIICKFGGCFAALLDFMHRYGVASRWSLTTLQDLNDNFSSLKVKLQDVGLNPRLPKLYKTRRSNPLPFQP